jgi:peptidoglycan hydrolase-like protein with peptidoglycan-binding domain
MLKMLLVVFLIMGLGGCATGGKKQPTQASTVNYEKSRTYQQEVYQRDHDNDDTWSPDTYEKSATKTYTGQAVQLSQRQIQRALKSAGFYQGPIDGKIGSKTKEAIIKFQKANGLKADGIVGKRTSAELNKYLSK